LLQLAGVASFVTSAHDSLESSLMQLEALEALWLGAAAVGG
jgi:hypothetical protein